MAFWNKKKKIVKEEVDEAEAILQEFDDDDEGYEADDEASFPSDEGKSQTINYSKLAWLSTGGPKQMTPEQLEGMFQGVCGPSSEPGWLEEVRNSRMSCIAVVQANASLYDPNQASWAPAVLLAFDTPESADPSFMEEQLVRLKQVLAAGQLPQLQQLLGDSSSSFSFDLPQEFTGGPLAKVFVSHLDPEKLPGGRIPPNNVMPALQHGSHWSQIPTSWYQ